MASPVVTDKAKKKMMLGRKNGTMATVAGIAFGRGGVDEYGNVITPLPTQNVLNDQIKRGAYTSATVINDKRCRYAYKLAEGEMVGEQVSELALYDSDGDLVIIHNFTPKTIDADISMEFQIDDYFN